MDFKKEFRNKLKEQTKGLDAQISSPLSFFNQINEEFNSEIDRNPLLKFKKTLLESRNEVTQNTSITGLFDLLEQTKEEFQEVIKEIPQLNEEVFVEQILEQEESPVEDLISLAVNSITKEKSAKSFQENTNLFSQPNANKPDSNIKGIQNKIKFLEDWVTKISMAGPGSGEVNFRWLDDVNRNSIGNTDQILRYNPNDGKFFFGQLSGDQGPVRSLNFDNSGTSIIPTSGTLSWNTAKDCLNVYQNDNSILQVGLENYIRVHNSTANTLTNGTLVMFSGVNGGGETPSCVPLLADSTFYPIYTIGVLTADIPSGENGRATTLGEIRNVDTSGTSSGEIWQQGDLLWASPYQAGKLTKIKPTAPNVVVSVAAVIKVGLTDGILLVRPTITPRLYYGSFYDTTTQYANTINQAYSVKLSNTQISSGFSIANNSQIVAQSSGLYNYQFSLQVQSDVSATHNIWVWYRKNGQDVPYSASIVTVNKAFSVLSWNFVESMQINDNFELMWAVDNSAVKIVSPSTTAFCPATPGVILTVTQANL